MRKKREIFVINYPFLIVGLIFIYLGFSFLISSISGVTGLVVSDDLVSQSKGLVGTMFLFTGLFFLYKSRQKKGQAAMEFLMTYGWVILIVIIVIGVLAYISLNSFRGNSQSVLSPPFIGGAVSIKDVGGGWSEVSFEVTNAGGRAVVLSEATIAGVKSGSCTPTNLNGEMLSSGAKTIVIVVCNNLADVSSGTLSIKYTTVGVLEQTSGGEVKLNSRNAVQGSPSGGGGGGSPPVIALVSLGGGSTLPIITNNPSPVAIVDTNVGADCRWAFNDYSYSTMSSANTCFTATGLSHSCSISTIIDGAYTFYSSCLDTSGNPLENGPGNNLNVPFTVDTLPPVQSGWVPPDGSLVGTSFDIAFSLNENGDCKYEIDNDFGYDQATKDCSGDGTTSISCPIILSGAGSWEIYLNCRDALNNKDTSETNTRLSFTVP